MSHKDQYIAKMEAQLDDWRLKLDAMKAKLEEVQIQGRLEFHRQVDASQRQHELARQQLDELKQSSQDAWEALKAGMDGIWKELAAASKGGPN